MRIAYVVQTYPKLSETFVAAEIAAVRAAGHEVAVFAWHYETTPSPDVHYGRWRDGLQTPDAVVGIIRSVPRWCTDPRSALAAIGHASKLYRSVRDYRPDVIHAHFATEPTAVALAIGQRLGVPVTATFHALDYLVGVSAKDLRARVQQLAATCVISEDAAGQVVRITGGPADRIHLVRAGVSASVMAAVDRPPPPPDGSLRLISVARLVPKKGFAELIAGLHRYRQRQPDQLITLDIVGDGPLRAELRQLVDRLELSDVVTLHGAQPHDEVVAQIARANAAALICVVADGGDVDGIPVFLMEAAAAGLPIVTTDVGGNLELITDGLSGVIVPGVGPDAIADGLEQLTEHPGYGVAARARLVVEFSSSLQAQRLTRIWDDVLGRPC